MQAPATPRQSNTPKPMNKHCTPERKEMQHRRTYDGDRCQSDTGKSCLSVSLPPALTPYEPFSEALSSQHFSSTTPATILNRKTWTTNTAVQGPSLARANCASALHAIHRTVDLGSLTRDPSLRLPTSAHRQAADDAGKTRTRRRGTREANRTLIPNGETVVALAYDAAASTSMRHPDGPVCRGIAMATGTQGEAASRFAAECRTVRVHARRR